MAQADSTAVRTALWRALHLELEAAPHVFEDTLALKLADPPAGWRERGDMHPQGTKPFRASIVGRARFIEELVTREAAHGVPQYVLLGAGLDTFAQRRADLAARVRVFEIDRPEPQAWKRERLSELGFGIPEHLRFVQLDFEAGAPWRAGLRAAGFATNKPAVVASTGVSMYLTPEANRETLAEVAKLAPGSIFAMTFLLPLERADDAVRPGLEQSAKGAKASGTPFISFFEPADLLQMAREAGFKEVEHVSAEELTARFFAGRTDGFAPPKNGEEFLVGRT